MDIREVGAHLSVWALPWRLARAAHLPCRPTVWPLCHHLAVAACALGAARAACLAPSCGL